MRVFLALHFEKYLYSGLKFHHTLIKCTHSYYCTKKIDEKNDDHRQCCHPNIVELTDVVQSDGRLYLVFEFVDRDLKKLFDATEGLLPPAAVLSYTRQLLEGLNYCHVRGIMHR